MAIPRKRTPQRTVLIEPYLHYYLGFDTVRCITTLLIPVIDVLFLSFFVNLSEIVNQRSGLTKLMVATFKPVNNFR